MQCILVAYETDNQKNNADFIIRNYYKDASVRVIDLRGKTVKIDDVEKGKFDFNGFSSFLGSIPALLRLKMFLSAPEQQPDLFLSAQFTGLNMLAVSSLVKTERILLDDGLASPTILQKPGFLFDYMGARFVVKFYLLALIFRLLLFRKLLNPQEIINDIKLAYSDFDHSKQVPTEIINQYGVSVAGYDTTKAGFIGQNLVESRLISKQELVDILKTLALKTGPVIYYAHPKEHWYEDIRIEGMEFRKNSTTIENFALEHPMPQQLFSFFSSALINLAKILPEAKIRYIKIPAHASLKLLPYELFEQLGIEEYNYSG